MNKAENFMILLPWFLFSFSWLKRYIKTHCSVNQGDVFGQISPICLSQLDRQETDAFLCPECSNSYNFVCWGRQRHNTPSSSYFLTRRHITISYLVHNTTSSAHVTSHFGRAIRLPFLRAKSRNFRAL